MSNWPLAHTIGGVTGPDQNSPNPYLGQLPVLKSGTALSSLALSFKGVGHVPCVSATGKWSTFIIIIINCLNIISCYLMVSKTLYIHI